MDLLSLWLQGNMDVVFFYGMCFFLVFCAVLFKKDKELSGSGFSRIIWGLAAFGLTHALCEWSDMWGIIKGKNAVLAGTSAFFLVSSFIFLLYFGVRLIFISFKEESSSEKASDLFIHLGAIFAVATLIFTVGGISGVKIETITNLSRHLIAFPAAFLTAAGFILYYRRIKDKSGVRQLKKYFYALSAGFFSYGVFAGVIGDKGDSFIAPFINTEIFFAKIHFPVQVFRALCAAVVAWSVFRVLRVFNREFVQVLKDEVDKKDVKLRETEMFVNKVFDSMHESVIILDPRTYKILKVNAAFFRKLGVKEDEILGKCCYEVTRHRTSPCESEDEPCPLKKTLSSGKYSAAEHIHYDKSGNAICAEISTTPVFDREGKIKNIIYIMRDITEYRLMERKLRDSYEENVVMQSQLLQSEKMSTMGQLAGGVAHEINNPLTGVLNNAQLIKMMLADSNGCDPAQFKELLDVIEEAALRCKKITTSLLDFSHASIGAYEDVDMNKIIEKVTLLIENEMKLQNIVLEKGLVNGIPLVKGDPQLLQQEIVNLITNAKWALEKKFGRSSGGLIRLETEISASDKRVFVKVSDNGTGIPKEKIDRIFEPFFTSKGLGSGTGLGLYIVSSLIRKHKGTVSVESKLNEGTVFKISLPFIS